MIGDPNAADAIMHLLNDGDENVQTAAAYALGVLGRDEAVSVLAQAAQGKDKWEAFRAIVGLGKLETPDARAAIKTAGAQANLYDVRQLAKRCQKTSLSQAFADFLAHPGRPYLAGTVAKALLYLNDPAALDALDDACRVGRYSTDRPAIRKAAWRIRRLASKKSDTTSSRASPKTSVCRAPRSRPLAGPSPRPADACFGTRLAESPTTRTLHWTLL